MLFLALGSRVFDGRLSGASDRAEMGSPALAPVSTPIIGERFTPTGANAEEQTTLGDYAQELAETARDTGAEGSLYSAGEWAVRAQAILDELIAKASDFTAEDITSIVGAAPSPNAIGALFLQASRARRIRVVGWRKAQRVQAHARGLRVWRGVE